MRSESVPDARSSIAPSQSRAFDPLYDATPQPGPANQSASNLHAGNGLESGPFLGTRGARRAASSVSASDEDDDTDPASLATKLDVLEESIKGKNKAYQDAQAAAARAQEKYKISNMRFSKT